MNIFSVFRFIYKVVVKKYADRFITCILVKYGLAFDTCKGKLKQMRQYFKRFVDDGVVSLSVFVGAKLSKTFNCPKNVKESRLHISYWYEKMA